MKLVRLQNRKGLASLVVISLSSACLLLALSVVGPSAPVRAHSLGNGNSNENSLHSNEHGGQHLSGGAQMQRQPNSKSSLSASQSGASQNRCQSGWMWFNNKCWVTTLSRRDFVHAVELCKKMYNSTLPTIHSEDENEFLRQNIDLHNSPIWLYARHNHQYNKTRWLDKSPVNYTRWDSGQPSDRSSLVCIKTEDSWYMKKADPVEGQTECVSFWEDAKWGTQVGCLVLLPVVCEKKLTPISRLTDGPNGNISSQYEQQQMSISAAGRLSLIGGAHLILSICTSLLYALMPISSNSLVRICYH